MMIPQYCPNPAHVEVKKKAQCALCHRYKGQSVRMAFGFPFAWGHCTAIYAGNQSSEAIFQYQLSIDIPAPG